MTPPSPHPTPQAVELYAAAGVRCPGCGSTRAGIDEVQLLDMTVTITCRRCGEKFVDVPRPVRMISESRDRGRP